MRSSKGILKMVVISMMIAIEVAISPILRVEGMCPDGTLCKCCVCVFFRSWVFRCYVRH